MNEFGALKTREKAVLFYLQELRQMLRSFYISHPTLCHTDTTDLMCTASAGSVIKPLQMAADLPERTLTALQKGLISTVNKKNPPVFYLFKLLVN